MELQELKLKKMHGDAIRIMMIVNAKRVSEGKKTYSKHTVKSMLNGNRTISIDVERAAQTFYETMSKLSEI